MKPALFPRGRPALPPSLLAPLGHLQTLPGAGGRARGSRGALADGPVARATPFRPPAGPGGNMERGGAGPGAGGPFLACACFLTDNLFVERYGLHLRYLGDPELLRRDFGPVLRQRGCRSEEDFAAVLREVEKEVQRRKELGRQSRERTAIISQNYKPKHPQLYILQESFFNPEFLKTVKYCKSQNADLQGLLHRVESLSDKRIYRLPIFTKEFCEAFIEELEHFEQSEMPKGRPNSMNNYGVLLNELGLDETFLTPLRENYLQPLTALLYPDCGGSCLDSHKAFVVKYALRKDLDLHTHYDNAEVTLNVCLGKEFTEGSLYFAELRQDAKPEPNYLEVEHVLCYGLFHRGGQLHGALPIASGERRNLIIWMRSSAVRNHLCPMCDRVPDLIEAEGFGDGFTGSLEGSPPGTTDVCSLT